MNRKNGSKPGGREHPRSMSHKHFRLLRQGLFWVFIFLSEIFLSELLLFNCQPVREASVLDGEPTGSIIAGMRKHTLEFNWDGVRCVGEVTIETVGRKSIHQLSFQGRPVAIFEQASDRSDAEGQTRLLDGNEIVGNGNLLAGVLLWARLSHLKKGQAHKLAFKDFLRDWLSTF